jgi:hypothetical protein
MMPETPGTMAVRYLGLVAIMSDLPWLVRKLWLRGVDLDAERAKGRAFYREQTAALCGGAAVKVYWVYDGELSDVRHGPEDVAVIRLEVTADMVERAARVHADWEGLDHQDSIREQARAMLVAALGQEQKP